MIELRPAKYLLGRLAPMDNNDKIPQFNLGAGTYDSTVFLRGDGVWADPLAGGYVPTSRTITINGDTQDLSANRTWLIDKASVGLGNVDNTSDLNKPISIATQTALNAKQDTITLTTSGSSGPATLIGATLNIPNYGSLLTGYVPYVGATADLDLGANTLLAHDMVINHGSSSGTAASIIKGGSGIGLSINKSGSGESLTVVKSSGSGNAASILGGITLLDELHLNTDLADSYIASSANWNAAYNDKINSASITGTTTKTLTLNQQDGGTITASWTDINTDAVSSVFGRTGAVVAVGGDYNTSQVIESGNLYFTDARARGSISLTTSGTSGAATYNNLTGVLNIPQYQPVITNPVTGTGTTNYLPKFTGATTIGDSQIFDNGTNVGIDTTSPNYKLDVNGFIGASRIYPYNSNNTYITGDGNAGMAVVGSGYFYVSATGGSYFQNEVRFRSRIENDTNAFLQINGGTTGVTYFAGTIGVGGSNVFHSSSIQVGKGIFFSQDNGSDIGGKIYGYWDTGYQPYAGGLNFQVFRVETGSYQMYDAMTLSAGGNLGIGTTAPQTRLHVNGAVTWGSTTGQYMFAGGNTHKFGYADSNSNVFYSGGSGGFGVNNQADSIRLFQITDSGSVGIGTTAPKSKFDVTDWTVYQSLTSVANSESTYDGQPLAGINFRKHYGIGIGAAIRQLQGGGVNNYSQAHLAFYTNDASIGWNDPVERMRITYTGNVGIGTTSPTWKFVVSKGGAAGLEIDPDTGSPGVIGVYAYNRSTSAYLPITFEASQYNFQGGNVGIGTTSPSNKLHIAQDFFNFIRVEAVGYGSTYFGTSGANSIIYNDTGNPMDPGMNFYLDIGNDIILRPNFGSELMRLVASTSNVGIGTSTPDPSAILDVTSTTKGFLPPRMEEYQRDAISAAEGLIIFNINSQELNVWAGGSWRKIAYV